MRLLKNAAALICAAAFYIGISANAYALESGGIGEVTKCYELTTSYDTDNYSKITISKNEIKVEGKYLFDEVDSVFFSAGESVTLELESKENGEFFAHAFLDEAKPQKDKDEGQVYIKFTSGSIIDYLAKYDNGWYFPDNGGKDGFAHVLDNIYDTSSAAWAYYLCNEPDEKTVRETLDEIRSLSDEITEGLASDREKAFAIADWVSENIYYDLDARNNSVTLSTVCLSNVLKEHKTVCSGFTNLYCALLEAQGIRAVNIKGSVAANGITYDQLSSSPQNHEWSAVLLDGRWTFIDVVWDTGNIFISGEYSKGDVTVQYRDITPLALSFDHRADRAEQRYYFRAMEYFEQSESDREEFSFEDLSRHEAPKNDYIVSFYAIAIIVVVAAALIAILKIKEKRKTK